MKSPMEPGIETDASTADLQRFIEIVSHDFRGPIAVIKEFTAIILDGLAGEVADPQRKYLRMIADGIDELEAAVGDLVDMGRFDVAAIAPMRAPCGVNDIVEPIRAKLEGRAALHDARLEIIIPDDAPRMFCDAAQISRAIAGLATRALRTADAGGWIRIRFQASDREPDTVICEIEDDGPGFNAEKLLVVQERCRASDSRERAAVADIEPGLNVAFQLIELNLGEINVTAGPSRGLRIAFTIPTVDPAALVRRFLDYAARLRGDADHASACLIRADSDADPATLARIETFLHYHIRRSDMILALKPGSWFALMPGNASNSSSVVRRLESAWRDSGTVQPGRAMPVLSVETIGCWRVDSEEQTMLSAIERVFADHP